MTFALEYGYKPLFGIENYLPPTNGIADRGGAEQTNDNLLITLWEISENGNGDFIGDLIIPAYADDITVFGETVPPQHRNGFRQGMKSRVASRFALSGEEIKGTPLLAVLNPPQEYKQQIARAIERVGDVVADEEEAVAFNKPLGGVDAWWVKSSVIFSASEADMIGGFQETPLDIGSIYSVPLGELPYLKTNGADGNKPEFLRPFDAFPTNSQIDAEIAALNNGDFFIAMVLELGGAVPPFTVSIEWPYSTSRG